MNFDYETRNGILVFLLCANWGLTESFRTDGNFKAMAIHRAEAVGNVHEPIEELAKAFDMEVIREA